MPEQAVLRPPGRHHTRRDPGDDGFRAALARALGEVPADGDARAVWRALGDHGVLRGLYRHADTGGATADPARLGALLHAVDERADNGVTLTVLVQAASALPLLTAGTTDACAGLRERVLDGRVTLALAATDSAAPGSELTALGTEVRWDERTLHLNGGKRWVSGAGSADHFLVLARHRPGRHFTSFTWVLVPAAAAGVRIEPVDTGGLLASAALGHVRLDDVRLDVDHLIGRPGRAMASFARHMATERLAGAQWAVALLRRTLTATRRHLTARPAGEGTLWDNAAIRQDFAACLVRTEQLRALVETTVRTAGGTPGMSAAALLKAAVGQTADDVLGRCAQLQGADGMTAGGAHHVRAEAAVLGLGGGATELMLAHVADAADVLLDDLRPVP
ncbi:acyl-CoA dehydrogenase family protein [Streptomyces sp. NRRL S-1022]|uniref:acyl-CoA dehydrogenase family protein n=1 Tax=Streptomyces sp. NRRL S-1022 TaxID=1463880 RepID=UPI000B2202D4|nr:acyl-CoA dehydrogenase [Streptomyces sp. NRRL S-1022]